MDSSGKIKLPWTEKLIRDGVTSCSWKVIPLSTYCSVVTDSLLTELSGLSARNGLGYICACQKCESLFKNFHSVE